MPKKEKPLTKKERDAKRKKHKEKGKVQAIRPQHDIKGAARRGQGRLGRQLFREGQRDVERERTGHVHRLCEKGLGACSEACHREGPFGQVL